MQEDDAITSAAGLRRRAAALRDQAQEAFHQARELGEVPDRELILSCTRQSKIFDNQALELEDQSHTNLSPAGAVSQEQIDTWQAQLLISRVEEGLFISGYDAVQDDACLQDRKITHILSVCRYHLPSAEQAMKYQCKTIPVLDTSDENIIQYFTEANDFIRTARTDAGGSVLVHCHAGQSRSAAMIAAYLMQRDTMTLHAALQIIKRVRRVQPNENFMNQLRLYADCDFNISNESALYRRWKFENMHRAFSNLSQADSAAPTTQTRYQETDTSSKYTQIRCKKCRFVLASENHLILHEPKVAPELQQPEAQQSSLLPSSCAHFFLEPIRWMKAELDRGEVDGRFTCPNTKCGAKIGSYAWQGMTCSCRRWVLPALCLQRGKVDELRSRTPAKVEPARKLPKARD